MLFRSKLLSFSSKAAGALVHGVLYAVTMATMASISGGDAVAASTYEVTVSPKSSTASAAALATLSRHATSQSSQSSIPETASIVSPRVSSIAAVIGLPAEIVTSTSGIEKLKDFSC